MCDINDAFKLMIEETPGMTYRKLAMMIGEGNWKKLQALFDPDREDRPFQMKHMIPTMAACNNLTPLHLMAAHFGFCMFEVGTGDIGNETIDAQTVIKLLERATASANEITKALHPDGPGGTDITREENQMCLNKALRAMDVLMRIVNELQRQAQDEGWATS